MHGRTTHRFKKHNVVYSSIHCSHPTHISYPPILYEHGYVHVLPTCPIWHMHKHGDAHMSDPPVPTDRHAHTRPIWHTRTNMVIYTSYPPVPYIRHAQTWWCTHVLSTCPIWHTCTNMVMYPCPTHLSHSTHMHKHGDVGMGSGQRMQEWRGLRRQGDVGLWRSSSQLLQQDGAARIFQRSVQRLQFLQHVIQVEQALFHHLGLSWQRLKQTGNKK